MCLEFNPLLPLSLTLTHTPLLAHTHSNTLWAYHPATEEEDDDGAYAQTKEDYIEALKELEQEGASVELVLCSLCRDLWSYNGCIT